MGKGVTRRRTRITAKARRCTKEPSCSGACDLRVAAQVCDTVAVMHRGEVVEHGPAAEIFARPQHAYTKSLFEAAPGRDWDFGRFQAA